MTWLYSHHPVRTAFLLITLAYGIGAAAILKRASRAPDGGTNAGV